MSPQDTKSAAAPADPTWSTPPGAGPLLYRPEEAAEMLGCGRAYVYQLIARGTLHSVKVGRLRRIPAVALNEFIAGLST